MSSDKEGFDPVHDVVDADRRYSRDELLRRAAAGAVAVGVLPLGATLANAANTRPRRGGRLRVAVPSSKAETLDPHAASQEHDIALGRALYDRVADFGRDMKPYLTLAEEITPNGAGTVWTIRLKKNVVFHNGKHLTADDVVYSYRRILNKKLALQATADLPFLKPTDVQRVDKHTVRLHLTRPIGDLVTILAARGANIIPAGYTNFRQPVGTGPFKLKKWLPGQSTTFARFDQYWGDHGRPYLDELVILPVADSATRLNALLAGQVDTIVQVEPTQVGTLKSNKMGLLNAKSGQWTPMVMALQRPPFTDVRVRQAFRLMVDREQMGTNVLLGYGSIGNDLFSPLDPLYARDLPQRKPDIDKAKFLLKQAGQSDLAVTLYTADFAPGALSSATLFAPQASKAGATVNLNKWAADSYYSGPYEKQAFFQTEWGTRPLDSQMLQCVNRASPYNETQWLSQKFDSLTNKALSTVNPARRQALYHDAQEQLWNSGGYIIWGFPNNLDAYSPKVHGLTPHPFRNLGWYKYQDIWVG